MKYWFTTSSPEGGYRENAEWLVVLSERVIASGNSHYQPALSAAEADAIVFFEPNYYKDKKYIHLLLSDPLIQEYPNKCFTVDYEDGPIGILPGVYVGLPSSQMDVRRFRAGCYMGQYNTLTTEMAEQRDQPCKLLFSFRGSASAEVRKKLFEMKFPGDEYIIQQTFAWFNHSEDDKRAYVQEILDSKFVLCPRGLAPVSIRLFETMELGRVPVILSDEWVAPDGPSWSKFSLHLAESRLVELPQLLRDYEPYACEMGRLARLAWEQWFSPNARVLHVLGSIEDIMRRRPADHDERAIQKEWLTLSFAWRHGWTPPQSLYRNIRQGTLVKKIRGKFFRQTPANISTNP